MSRRAVGRTVDVILPFLWLPLLLVYMLHIHGEATFRNAEVEVVSSPYLESPTLQYLWRGDVHQSCPIVIDRKIITSERVVITLESSPLLPGLPVNDLGPTVIPISVETPSELPPGPSIYQATERPRCNWLQRISPPEIPYPPVFFTVEN